MGRPDDLCATSELDAAVARASPNDPWTMRVGLSQLLGLAGIVLYNWWVYVLVATTVLASTDEFFSDLEATGRPDAALLQHLDLAAGIVMVAAFLLRGPWGPNGKRREWRWLVVFAVAGAIGGHYSYACPEGLSAACRSAEWHLRLPLHHYLHVVSGVIEFAMMTTAVYFAWRRTRNDGGWVAHAVTWTGVALLIGYPLLALAYLLDEFGAIVEPIFFVAYSVMVFVELFEPSRKHVTHR